jgi:hypothetical protein
VLVLLGVLGALPGRQLFHPIAGGWVERDQPPVARSLFINKFVDECSHFCLYFAHPNNEKDCSEDQRIQAVA